MSKIGSYEIEEHLGSFEDRWYDPDFLGEDWYRIEVGVNIVFIK